MEWKRIKTMLIVLFLGINIFLAFMIYRENIKGYVDTVDAINAVFASNKIVLKPNINKIEKNIKMQKIIISDNSGINDDLLINIEDSVAYEHIGSKKSVISVTTLLANFIRDISPSDLTISDIYICYFYNSERIDEHVLSGEAEPCWVIETDNIKYIYNAYNGNLLAQK